MTKEEKEALADRLESGLQSDIFYDAFEYDDEEAENTIEDFQLACMEAIKLLRE